MQDIGPMRVGGAMKQCAVTAPEQDDDLSRTVARPTVGQSTRDLESDLRPVIGLLVGALVGTLIWIVFGVAICACLKLIPG